jgi:hypothetical protein
VTVITLKYHSDHTFKKEGEFSHVFSQITHGAIYLSLLPHLHFKHMHLYWILGSQHAVTGDSCLLACYTVVTTKQSLLLTYLLTYSMEQSPSSGAN